MGTVHGVYLKYVGLSALSVWGISLFLKNEDGTKLTLWKMLGASSRSLLLLGSTGSSSRSAGYETVSLWRAVPVLVLSYSAALNGLIAALFKLEVGMEMLGKNRKTGQIPTWSYLLYFPFHLPTILYTYVHTKTGTYKAKEVQPNGTIATKKKVVPVADQVQPGWWVGGCYAHELDKDWAAVIDLTVEFPEKTINRTRAYLSIPTWDGVPASAEQLEEAATFALQAKLGAVDTGDVLVHCAHGRGRSTTVMCACLVKAGLFKNWQEALELGIQPQRPVCKLNRRMRQALTAWQELYVDQAREKKGQ